MVGLDPAYPDHVRYAVSNFSKDVIRITDANMRPRAPCSQGPRTRTVVSTARPYIGLLMHLNERQLS